MPRKLPTVLRQLVSFGTIGVVGFVVDAGVLHVLLRDTNAGFYVGRLVSFLCAATVTWYLNRTFTFRGAGRRSGLHFEWLRFLAANGVGGLVNFGVYSLLVSKVALFTAAPVLAVAVGSLSGLSVNFALTRTYIYRTRLPA